MVSLKSTLLAGLALAAQQVVGVDLAVKPTGGNKTSPIFYGLMHEDINNSGDGGIYAELIRNRAFQNSVKYPVSLDGWSPVGADTKLEIKKLAKPLSSALQYSVAVSGSSGKIGLANSGFWGIDVKKQPYSGSFYVRGAYEGKFTASLQSVLGDKEVFGSVDIASKSVADGWTQHSFTLVPKKDAPNSNNTLAITWEAKGAKELDLNLISLFPPTWKGRKNGLRVDLAEAFAALNPKFLRFPGGNMLMGHTLGTYWKWNETIGPLTERPGSDGTWEYPISTGMGLIEYMEWADDLGVDVILGVYAGLALDGNYTNEAETDYFVQYALDEIEFLTGPVSTPWGAKRAALGYPKPWTVKYVEIGNEDWLAGRPNSYDAYKEYRFPKFYNAIKAKHPEIQLLASPSVFDGFTHPADVIGDWHPYLTPDGLVQRFNRTDHLTMANRTLIGEAAATHPNGGLAWDGPLAANPWWGGSVAEAIFLLGQERNADRVIGACYAPQMRNLNRWQWGMTLVQFAADTSLTTMSTSWYVWKLLGEHVITKTRPVTVSNGKIDPLFFVAGDGEHGNAVVKLAVYNATAPVSVNLKLEDIAEGTEATLYTLTGPADEYKINEPFERTNVVKEASKKLVAGKDGAYEFSLPRLSVAVLVTEKGKEGKGKEHGGKGKDVKGKHKARRSIWF